MLAFGASGRCGSHFVRLAAAAGHSVTAVVRAQTSYTPPANVNVARGDVLSADFVNATTPGHDVVVSALGMRYRHPWARRLSPESFTSTATRHIVDAMRGANIHRLAVISAAGVGDSRARANWVIRFMIATSNVGYAYADLERMEAVLKGSALDWLAVRPTTLSNRRGTGRVAITDAYPMTASIPREDVAKFLLQEIEAPQFAARTPMIRSC